MQILAKTAIIVLRAVYFFFKLFLKPAKKITLLSRQSNTPSDDFLLLRDAVIQQNPDIKVKIIAKKIPDGIFKKAGYGFSVFSQMYHIATSRVIVIDGYSIAVSVLKHKSNQKVVQIWHALNIVKKFGYATLGKPWGRNRQIAEIMCMHKNYDYFVACSENSAKVLAECFNMPSEKAVLLPLPRIDYILNSPDKRNEIENAYPDIFKKPILLYAPTFRGNKVDLSWCEKAVDFEKYNVVVKLHPSDTFGCDCENPNILIDRKFTSFDWIKVCDSVITDYSGMGFEAMLLNKKVYFYLYDYDEYTKNNGLAINLWDEPIKQNVTKTADGLKAVLEKEYDFAGAEKYKEKYLSVGTKDCALRLAEFIINLSEEN